MKPLEKYSDWSRRTKSFEDISVQVPVAPTYRNSSQPERAGMWATGMEHPKEERAMVRSLTAWIDQVVKPFRDQFTAPAQMAIDKELLILMHGGKGQKYADLARAADELCERVNADKLLSGEIIKPSDLKSRYSELFQGGIGFRFDRTPNNGFAAARTPVDAMHLFGRCAGRLEGPVKLSPTMRVQAMSARLFQDGAPGSAWTGICQMGRRSGKNYDIVYLVPNASVGSHLGFEHSVGTKREVPPGEHGLQGQTSHSYACAAIRDKMGGFDIEDGKWNGRPKDDWFDPQSSGIFWGFSIVRSFNILGHLYAWTSVSTNRFGSSIYYHDLGETDPTLTSEEFAALPLKERAKLMNAQTQNELGVKVYGGDTDVAQDWAYAIWQATKDLR